MSVIFAVDPGTTESAFLRMEAGQIVARGKVPNAESTAHATQLQKHTPP